MLVMCSICGGAHKAADHQFQCSGMSTHTPPLNADAPANVLIARVRILPLQRAIWPLTSHALYGLGIELPTTAPETPPMRTRVQRSPWKMTPIPTICRLPFKYGSTTYANHVGECEVS